MSIRSRLLISLTFLTLVIAALIAMGMYGTQVMSVAVDSVVDNEVVALQQLKAVSDDYAVAIVDNSHKARNGGVDWDTAVKTIEDASADVKLNWQNYRSTTLTAEEIQLADVVDARMADVAPMIENLIGIMRAHDQPALVSFIEQRLYQGIDPITGAIDQLIGIQDNLARVTQDEAQAAHSAIGLVQLVLAAVSVAALGFGGYVIVRSVAGRLGKMQAALADVASGKLDTIIPFASRRDEIGRIAVAAEVFRVNGLKIKEMAEAQTQAQVEATEARRAMMRELRTSFGTVVDASVAGDFSTRVATAFDDEELNGLAESVNTLVATVERGIGETDQVLTAIAQTDLTVRMRGTYQGAFARLSDSVNSVANNLASVISTLRETSSGVKLATSEILTGANDLSERTTKQAATIEETSAAVEQLSVTVAENARSASDASSKASVAAEAATEGGAVMREATDAMQRISTSSAKISNVIGLIDDIAFQTNLLALNASVEAARAGEAGKGFAVVAIEVRRLAQSAANASSEVKALIQQSWDEVKSGSSLVDRAAEKLNTMLGLVREGARSMESIARASTEQASAIAEINTAVREMDEMTQHNAALVEETNAAIEQTETQADELDRIVAGFRVEQEGVVRQAPPKRPILLKSRTATARRYLTDGNAAVSQDWSEF